MGEPRQKQLQGQGVAKEHEVRFVGQQLVERRPQALRRPADPSERIVALPEPIGRPTTGILNRSLCSTLPLAVTAVFF